MKRARPRAMVFMCAPLLVALSIGCCTSPPGTSPDTGSPRAFVADHECLVENLRAAGITVDVGDSIEQPFLKAPGVILRLSGGGLAQPADIQSYNYDNEQDARRDVDGIDPGVQSRTTQITWIATPHLYGKERVLVLYVGDDPAVLELLSGQLGEPIR